MTKASLIDRINGILPKSGYETDEKFALEMDLNDPLGDYRDRFYIPSYYGGEQRIYFSGNSLGLMPRAAREIIDAELNDWARLGVGGHRKEVRPWFSYHEKLSELAGELVGAKADEAVVMNGLSVNLHLMMVSFYQPIEGRYKILTESPQFPSDRYACETQVRLYGYTPEDAIIEIKPKDGESTLRTDDIEAIILEKGSEIALIMIGGVNYATGQLFDMERITRTGHKMGCTVGFDLAHAAGNVPLKLHDWDVDFAVWCSYKYLNCGPGAVAGCFVHEKHGKNLELRRLAGWWGNDPKTRFEMKPGFIPCEGAHGWQISNPHIFSMAPMHASYAIFKEVGLEALRAKSMLLTGYLEFMLDSLKSKKFEIITPRNPHERGCQLSIRIFDNASTIVDGLKESGVSCDFREPDILRVAPVPLYNSFHDVWSFLRHFKREIK